MIYSDALKILFFKDPLFEWLDVHFTVTQNHCKILKLHFTEVADINLDIKVLLT